MQPPTINTLRIRPLRERFADLRVKVSEMNARQACASTETSTGSVEDFQAGIASWLTTLTPRQRERRYTMQEIEQLAGLTGKHGAGASHTRLGQALRKSGFIPGRDWTVAGRNSRYWTLKGEPK
jgi:hypothetical protein